VDDTSFIFSIIHLFSLVGRLSFCSNIEIPALDYKSGGHSDVRRVCFPFRGLVGYILYHWFAVHEGNVRMVRTALVCQKSN